MFSRDRTQHARHLRLIMDRLRKHKLYAKRTKCEIYTTKVKFLGFFVGVDGVSMDSSRIVTVTEWPESMTFREVQVFLGFANFYRCFIRNYSRVAGSLTNLLKGSKAGKKIGPFTFTEAAREAFAELKKTFVTASLLVHFDPLRET